MWQSILDWDTSTFRQINEISVAPYLDTLCPLLRNPFFWVPLYGFILTWALLRSRWGWQWVVVLFVVFAFTDLFSAQLIKPIVERVRPCHSLDFARRLVHCGSGYSFPSSHAANHFGISFFMLFTIARHSRWWTKSMLLLWAFAVSYAQIYVGVHYPLDVIAGGLLGWLIAQVISLYYLRRYA